ncbi:PIN domain-containing protein [Candidatus Bathyarchaeota archaeon]|nr:PIN domain-containing protein [Candidatus Bathyarchaeota archaeon]
MIEVYIDSNVIVASEIEGEEHHHESKQFMEYVLTSNKDDITFFTSIFTFVELASAMIRRTNDKDKAYSLLYRIRNSWKNSILPLPPIPHRSRPSFSEIVTEIVDTLIETSIQFRTPSSDTIHAQTVALYEIYYLVTWNVRHFSDMEKQIKRLKVMTPTEALLKFRGLNDKNTRMS